MMKSELRKFGILIGILFGILFGLFLPWLWDRPFPRWPWWVSLAFLLPAILWPAVLRPVHFLWMKLAHVLGWVNTRILLTVFYYLVLTPFAWILKVLGKDPLKASPTVVSTSYRVAPENPPARRMRDPY